MIRSMRGAALAATASLLFAATATAFPLGLQPGDLIESLEWQAYQSNPGDGGSYTDGTPGTVGMDGVIPSITISVAQTNPLSNVDFSIDADFVSFTTVPAFGTTVLATATFVSSSSVNPDFVVTENAATVLSGDINGNFIIEGLVDLANPTAAALQVSAILDITGGVQSVVNALGAQAELSMTGSLFDFSPGLAALFASGTPFDEDFDFSGDGILAPVSPSPFVPEPGTAVLLGIGFAGLAALRRQR